MLTKCLITAGAAVLIAVICALTMYAVPGKGWLRAVEELCGGIILCFLCSLLFRPLGLIIVNSPLAAFAAGCWGLPGTALAAFLAGWP